MSETTVVIADDDPLFAAALSGALAIEADLRVIANAHHVDDAYEAVRHNRPGLLVLDAELSGGGGATGLLARLQDPPGSTPTLALLRAPDTARLLELLDAGALACATRQQRLVDVVVAARLAASGEASVPGSMLGQVLRELVGRRRHADIVRTRFANLSRREREVLALLGAGHDQQQIATLLVISPETVRTHIQRLVGKLGVRSRIEAASLAAEHGLVDRRGSTGGKLATSR